MRKAALGFGSNLGDRIGMIEAAIAALRDEPGIEVLSLSPAYSTPPWGLEDQPDFINSCALIETSLEPEALLSVCKGVEKALGRQAGVRWGPRLIDVDVLWMDGVALRSPTLTLPHPRILERAFVLVPLAKILPDLMIEGRTITQHRDTIDTEGVEQVAG
ncbi:2-amino-4-hydroxy-6-hydroxymethyldihydropteridine diphosphokinase [Henriciella litoralis]|uniref:2-amino-4-hydroxy-6- hydroxymethyldihydropteridine diphosphokinase n=1 Tax=Henriciella litoralis TaxID=568102 RepID=UPI0009FBBD59|nr:2-amino-4-hydroxy-6-hydroxymethyldihydropteridine diphosphokinase [Henriciella litoralis]